MRFSAAVVARALVVLLLTACQSARIPIVRAPTPAATKPAVEVNTAANTNRSSAANATTSLSASRVSALKVDDVTRTVVSVFGDTAALHKSTRHVVDAEPVWDMDVRSYEAQERVAHYVQLFTTDARDHFVARLSRGTRYEAMIRAKLKASGMPEDMMYLALIESGYDPDAYSRSAAVGMWQFMTKTARDVGMRVDWWVDERRDPARSTDAAIRFLGDLQHKFGSLYLAAAAYNGGPGRVSRGLTRYAGQMEGTEGEDRFFALAEYDYLRVETKNYVPQLIAAALVGKKPARYGIVVDSQPLFVYDSVFVPAGTALAAVAAASGGTNVELRDLNPFLLRGMAPPDNGLWLRVPQGRAERTRAALDALPTAARVGYRSVNVSGKVTTLAGLAKSHGVTLREIAWYNPGLKSTKRGRLTAGQSVRVPSVDAIAFARAVPDPAIEHYGNAPLRRTAASKRRGGVKSPVGKHAVVVKHAVAKHAVTKHAVAKHAVAKHAVAKHAVVKKGKSAKKPTSKKKSALAKQSQSKKHLKLR